jgi:hypothetical protein
LQLLVHALGAPDSQLRGGGDEGVDLPIDLLDAPVGDLCGLAG